MQGQKSWYGNKYIYQLINELYNIYTNINVCISIYKTSKNFSITHSPLICARIVMSTCKNEHAKIQSATITKTPLII